MEILLHDIFTEVFEFILYYIFHFLFFVPINEMKHLIGSSATIAVFLGLIIIYFAKKAHLHLNDFKKKPVLLIVIFAAIIITIAVLPVSYAHFKFKLCDSYYSCIYQCKLDENKLQCIYSCNDKTNQEYDDIHWEDYTMSTSEMSETSRCVLTKCFLDNDDDKSDIDECIEEQCDEFERNRSGSQNLDASKS